MWMPSADHSGMCRTQRQMQEGQRIDQWLRLCRETLQQRLARQFGCASTFGVAAHAVEDSDQRHFGLDGGRDAILVFLTRTDQAELGVFDLQDRPPGRSARLLRDYCIAWDDLGQPSMIHSMTGYARAEAQLSTGILVAELRSVNHRYLEVALRLPEELRVLEPELRARLQQELRRGKVDCTFTYRVVAQTGRALELDAAHVERLSSLLRELTALAPRTGAQLQLGVVDLLRFPGVLREAAAEPEALLEAARELFGKALTDLKAMRASEGGRLQALVAERCKQLVEQVAQVRSRLPEVHAAIRTRYAERLAELTANINTERLEQEIALILQRMDVAEELDRLDGHITETQKILGGSEAAGRRLDFLMQEFNREANTLSSKSQDLATTRIAVDMKVLIEQMREQVQNIE